MGTAPDDAVASSHRLGLIRALLLRALLFAALWWVLTEGEARAWGVGAIFGTIALGGSLYLWPPGQRSLSVRGLSAFLAFFLWQSLRGGVAVAGLALRPRLRLRPEMRTLPLRLPPGLARVLFADVLSLMPGTVSADLAQDCLQVHVLDRALVVEADLRAAEEKVARLFRLELDHG